MSVAVAAKPTSRWQDDTKWITLGCHVEFEHDTVAISCNTRSATIFLDTIMATQPCRAAADWQT